MWNIPKFAETDKSILVYNSYKIKHYPKPEYDCYLENIMFICDTITSINSVIIQNKITIEKQECVPAQIFLIYLTASRTDIYALLLFTTFVRK